MLIIIFALGVLPDSSPLLVGSARSAALAGADTVLLLGARSYTMMIMKMAMCKMARGVMMMMMMIIRRMILTFLIAS